MFELNTEQYKVAEKISKQFSNSFDILQNVDAEQHFIGSMFPDMIFIDKTSKKPLFIIEIKKNGQVVNCMKQWKALVSIPATLYLIVPQAELQSAKSTAIVLGLNTKFGYYNIDLNGEANVIFE